LASVTNPPATFTELFHGGLQTSFERLTRPLIQFGKR
jgi:hypothetical protein